MSRERQAYTAYISQKTVANLTGTRYEKPSPEGFFNCTMIWIRQKH